MAKPVAFVATSELIRKNPSHVKNIQLFAQGLDILAKTATKTLELKDFTDLAASINQKQEFAVIANYVYDMYKEKISLPENYGKSAKVLSDIAQGIRDAVYLAAPSK